MLHVFRSVSPGHSRQPARGLLTAVLLCLMSFPAMPGLAAAAEQPEAKPATGAEPAEAAQSEAADAAGLAFFERKIRPVLIKHCYECHSAESKQLEGSLLIDTKAGLLAGGDSGPSLVPGKPEESLLVSALHYAADSYQMPPRGKLPDAVIADFEKWVAMGAPDPRTDTGSSPKKATGIDFAAAREFWSFQRPEAHAPPEVRQADWPQRPVDAFILAKLEAEGWAPSPEAAKRTLLRRATFDLTGLPPTPAEIRTFMEDEAPGAYARLIERLLESPHYGERWARHWLDVARYAEDNTNMGPFNGPYDHAWRYRDWVVEALNSDMPYDEFVRRQLATDLMESTGNDDLPALGFVAVAPSYHKELNLAKVELDNRFADEWEDRVDGIGRGLLGLTLACARCHDHKYDPVSNRDYYSLAGVFASTRQTTRPILPDEVVQQSEPARKQVAALEAQIAELQKQIKAEQTRLAAQKKELAAAEAAAKKEGRRTAVVAEKSVPFDIAAANTQIAAKKKEIASLKASTPNFDLPMANVLTEETVLVDGTNPNRSALVYKPNEPRDLPLFIRGDAGRLGDVVPRGFLTVLSPGDDRQKFEQGSGRLELAAAIVSRDNPLTARVIVNRVWAAHFGTGIVSTPSNFGETGARPTHPELLDDLAVRFMNNGWSLKWLHREIMLSATYRQTSAATKENLLRDPTNRLLGRFNRRRLDVEAFRDAILAATGTLDRSLGGPSADATDMKNQRRTVYSTVSRHRLNDFLQAFDFPDPAIHAAKRSETTTPLQQLFVLNSPWMRTQAAALAKSLNEMPEATLEQKVREAYARLYSREPSDQELAIARDFLQPNRSQAAPAESAAGSQAAERQPPEFTGSRVQGNVPGLGNTYSVELWFRNTVPNTKQPITGYFFSRGKVNASGSPGDHLGISGTARKPGVLLFYNGDTLKQSHLGTTIIEPGSWHHVVLIRDNGEIRVHLDGNEKPELSGPAKPGYADGITDILIGGRNDGFANFRGQLSDVAIYSRVLTADEIARHARAEGSPIAAAAPGSYEQLILAAKPAVYWPLASDQPGRRQATDLTATASHAVYEDRQGTGTGNGSPGLWERYTHALLSGNELLFVD